MLNIAYKITKFAFWVVVAIIIITAGALIYTAKMAKPKVDINTVVRNESSGETEKVSPPVFEDGTLPQ